MKITAVIFDFIVTASRVQEAINQLFRHWEINNTLLFTLDDMVESSGKSQFWNITSVCDDPGFNL